jgi:hypothetical protein
MRVQEIYKKYKNDSTTDAYIYRTYVNVVYAMTLRTFYSYLKINARKELKVRAEGSNSYPLKSK